MKTKSSVPRAKPCSRSSVAAVVPSSASDPATTDAIADAGVVEDAARDVGVGVEVLDRDEVGVGRDLAHRSQRAVTAIRAQFEQEPRLDTLDGGVEQRALLIATLIRKLSP